MKLKTAKLFPPGRLEGYPGMFRGLRMAILHHIKSTREGADLEDIFQSHFGRMWGFIAGSVDGLSERLKKGKG